MTESYSSTIKKKWILRISELKCRYKALLKANFFFIHVNFTIIKSHLEESLCSDERWHFSQTYASQIKKKLKQMSILQIVIFFSSIHRYDSVAVAIDSIGLLFQSGMLIHVSSIVFFYIEWIAYDIELKAVTNNVRGVFLTRVLITPFYPCYRFN